MEIILDFSIFREMGDVYAVQGFVGVFWFTLKNGAWLIYLWVLATGFYSMWLMNKRRSWYDSHKYIFLAIDIPKDTEQTPKAVEQLFATVSGAHTPLNLREIYVEGVFQLHFTFEIVSIDGYIQFLVRTPEQWRDLIESSVYSQYPDAEITEVEDYVADAPEKYPNDTHNIWGTEVVLDKHWVYPIKTYENFEDKVTGEYKDSLAALLETMSKIQVGEQVWLQIQVKPTGFDWVKESAKEAYRIAGKKPPAPKESIVMRMINGTFGFFFLSTGEPWFATEQGEGVRSYSKEENAMPSMMIHLTPGEKGAIEAIENKASKMAFECKIRLIYISPLEQYKPARVIASVFGSLKQFNTMDLNSFKPDPMTKTQVKYLFIKYRVNKRRERLMKAYKARAGSAGANWYILNIEELATIWHFPSKFVITPLLQKTESKKADPPFTLPVFEEEKDTDVPIDELRRQLVTPVGKKVNLQNDHYEKKYPKEEENDKAEVTEKIERKDDKPKPPTNLPT